jgi:hypothetical protein
MNAATPSAARRRVLIVSPNFPPINAPDMQRARMALPYLRDHGWEPVVLAVTPESAGTGVFEPLLEETYPNDIRVIRVRGIPPGRTRWLGIGSLWWRCGRALRLAGARLLATERFDVVLFTTTQFDAFTLGPLWRRQFGVPYVLDYQDPWINDYYHRTHTRPPGGWAKFNLTQWLARRREPAVVRQAAAILTVSSAYAEDLCRRYPDVDQGRFTLLPFGASPADFAVAAQHRPARPLIDFNDGHFHHVYTGRCGPDMELALSILFQAFRRYRETHPAEAERMRFHFIGTDYAPPPRGRERVLPLARAAGVASHVSEYTARVPYFDALHYLLRAQALVVVGSEDSSYTASKLFPYVLARRPMLLLFHRRSAVLAFAGRIHAGFALGFSGPADAGDLAAQVHDRWFAGGECRRSASFDEDAFRPFTAAALTARLAGILDRAAVSSPRS